MAEVAIFIQSSFEYSLHTEADYNIFLHHRWNKKRDSTAVGRKRYRNFQHIISIYFILFFTTLYSPITVYRRRLQINLLMESPIVFNLFRE